MNKIVTIIAILAIIFLAGILLFGNGAQEPENSGTVYFGVTDAAADMGSVSEVTMSASRVELHSESRGWVEAATNASSFDLLELDAQGKTELWAKAAVEQGTYDQVRLVIDTVEVTTQDGTQSEATLPSNTVTFTGNVDVEENATSSVVFDVEADRSLHMTEDGSFVFAPVVIMESRNGATVTVDQSNAVSINGGAVNAAVTVGVDLTGESKANFSVNPNTVINIGADGIIMTETGTDRSGEQGQNGTSGASVETEAEGGIEIDSDTGADVEVETEGGAEVQY